MLDLSAPCFYCRNWLLNLALIYHTLLVSLLFHHPSHLTIFCWRHLIFPTSKFDNALGLSSQTCSFLCVTSVPARSHSGDFKYHLGRNHQSYVSSPNLSHWILNSAIHLKGWVESNLICPNHAPPQTPPPRSFPSQQQHQLASPETPLCC